MSAIRVLSLIVLVVVSPQLAAAGTPADRPSPFVRALDRMMVELAASNAHASATVRREYAPYLNWLVLDEFSALEDALATGGLVPLPAEPGRFNLRPRTDGPAPIAEKDLAHQSHYVSARPATIGALLEIASQVTSGPLEITSLVRHTEYQDTLKATNGNAVTSVPMHTMGLAVDIALVNTPLETVREIRDVLRRMQDRGDILFIGERRQLVFHVVPHPSRLGYFTEVYTRAAAPGGDIRAADLVAAAPASPQRAVVETSVIAIRPTDADLTEWWAADQPPSDFTVLVSADARRGVVRRVAARVAAIVANLLGATRSVLA